MWETVIIKSEDVSDYRITSENNILLTFVHVGAYASVIETFPFLIFSSGLSDKEVALDFQLSVPVSSLLTNSNSVKTSARITFLKACILS